MLGPKLDARSYAILILAAITLVLGGKLIAQDNSGIGSQYQSSAEVAAATRDVAAATHDVAAANAQIADALHQIAMSIDNMHKPGSAEPMSTGGGITATGSSEAAVTPAAVPASEMNKGVFEVEKKK